MEHVGESYEASAVCSLERVVVKAHNAPSMGNQQKEACDHSARDRLRQNEQHRQVVLYSARCLRAIETCSQSACEDHELDHLEEWNHVYLTLQ